MRNHLLPALAFALLGCKHDTDTDTLDTGADDAGAGDTGAEDTGPPVDTSEPDTDDQDPVDTAALTDTSDTADTGDTYGSTTETVHVELGVAPATNLGLTNCPYVRAPSLPGASTLPRT